MSYIKINNLTGWSCFLVAAVTYMLTLEPSASFWDAGEFIAAAYKMQIVHQPGAPLYLMFERLLSIFAFGDKTKVAYFMNMGSALASAFTILFLFWTITALAKKILIKGNDEISVAKTISIMGAGIVGALAYTFSDSFWFSAVESEVYALSSLFTAIVFWAILKWEAIAEKPGADKWLLFIAYIMGLSIGIHLLNLLTIPAIAFVYYFKKTPHLSKAGIIKTFILGVLMLAVIQFGIIQYLVSIGAHFDLFFVNTLGLGFGSGVIAFAILLIGSLVYGIRYSIKYQRKLLNLGLLAVSLIIFGYCSFAMIVIRAQANPNLNNNDPDNAFSFLGYLNREQYGDRPLLSGPNFNSNPIDIKEGGNIYRKGADKYEIATVKRAYIYDKTTLFPRMHGDRDGHAGFYKDWMKLDEGHFPGVIDNIGFLFSYQIGHMYLRYFMWNFAGRQNDQQGFGNYVDGNWLSGIKPIDTLRLGNQSNLPPSIVESNSYNRFFFLPLILGLIGAVWHFNRSRKDAGIISLLFFFTGLAIVLYLNQTPLEPRERDYAFAGSFYAFAIWIGISVLAIQEWLVKKINPKSAAIGATIITFLTAPVLMAVEGWDDHDRTDKMVAHDIAVNYLESCAPNAILFTYGDNDTYPLWYAQEVENIRPDVRLVNLSLFDADWYLNGMKRQQNKSAPLPLSMKKDQYVNGVRDVIYYQDYQIAGNVELKTIMELLLSDNTEDQLQRQNGQYEKFLPTKNFKLTVNKADVIKYNAVSAADRAKIASELEWTYNKEFITKGTLAMLDILVNNHWERPIYFTKGMPPEQYNGLDNYLYNEGLVLRLMPLVNDNTQNKELINTPVLYQNLMNKFLWGNLKNASYLDTESQKHVSILTNIFNNTVSGLIKMGRKEDAKKVVARYFEVMPDKLYGIRSSASLYFMAENLYLLGEKQRANELLKRSSAYLQKEISYLADVSDSKHRVIGEQDIQLGMSFLNQMARTTAANGETKFSTELSNQFNALAARFSGHFSE